MSNKAERTDKMKNEIIVRLFAERFSALLNSSTENTYTVAEKLSLSPGTISRYRSGLMAPKMPTLSAIAEIFDVDPEWLCGKDVPRTRKKNKPAELNSPSVTADFVSFPVIGEVAAGYDHIAYEDWNGEVIDIPTSYLKGRPKSDYFVLSVCGDSMYPLYMQGDKVLILKQNSLNYSGQIGAVLYDNDCATLKRIEFSDGGEWLRLVPINPNYPPKRFENEELEKCRIIGIPQLIIREVEN